MTQSDLHWEHDAKVFGAGIPRLSPKYHIPFPDRGDPYGSGTSFGL